jgi:hypothetical protein
MLRAEFPVQRNKTSSTKLSRMTLWGKLLRNCVKTPTGCWRWQGALDKDGYAVVRVGKKVRRGHDVTWEIFHGRPIPPGHQPDHVCRNTSCVNPAHLDLVTCGENKRRAWLYQPRATHCPKGHAMTPANTYRRPGRKTRTCRKCEGVSRMRESAH